jgi:hypothetical protein
VRVHVLAPGGFFCRQGDGILDGRYFVGDLTKPVRDSSSESSLATASSRTSHTTLSAVSLRVRWGRDEPEMVALPLLLSARADTEAVATKHPLGTSPTQPVRPGEDRVLG